MSDGIDCNDKDDDDKGQWSESGLVHFPKYWWLPAPALALIILWWQWRQWQQNLSWAVQNFGNTMHDSGNDDSGNSVVHNKDDNLLLYKNVPQTVFVIVVFCICFSSCILSLLSYACAGTQLGGRCLLCGNYYKVCHQRDTYNQTLPVLQLLFSNYLQRFFVIVFCICFSSFIV